jgi:cytoplasmic iron level regulating protein YaaA (DUF328/UPF0246 family)
MKIIYLLPPSEGKNTWWIIWAESLSFDFKKPLDIAVYATEKDLKCKDKRYEQGIHLNKNIESSEILPVIERYSWVMYNAINYVWMSGDWKKYFEDYFIILSGMFGLLKPIDNIGNYKLPIETKWLYKFWWESITQTLNNLEVDYIVDMLPWSYAKMIDWKNINAQILRVNFLYEKDWEIKKISHWVKKVKGEYIKNICEKCIDEIDSFPGKKVQISQNEYHINIISK